MKRWITSFIALAAVLLIAVGLRLLVSGGGGDHAAPAIGGPFTLVDGDGRTVTEATFKGRFMLIYFGYTYCPDVCPTSLAQMVAALDKLPPATQDKVVPIFITVDPARDTPQVVKGYAAAFHPRMVGLTGSEEQVAAVEKAFKVYAAKVKGDDPQSYTMDHSSITYLMGPDGRFLAHFAHGASVAEMAERLGKL
jgi:protein SCO1/2